MYDYVAGKADWLGMGMPTEGALSNATIKSVMHEVPMCRLKGNNFTVVKSRISLDWDFLVVIDTKQIVLGILELPIPTGSYDAIVDLMKPAPRTFRPSVLIADAKAYFDQRNLTSALVTKSTGELMGVIRKTDLQEFVNVVAS